MCDIEKESIPPLDEPPWKPFLNGQQITIPNRTSLPFQHIRNIGRGSSAVIELVSHKPTKQRFALKTFRRYHGRQFQADKRAFENEVKIMTRLSSHRHIVSVIGSYVCDQELGILMSPAASDGDLAAYLFRVLECGLGREQERVLSRAFGCLSNGLAYIHEHTIRHKDIKPQNILVHHGSVLYTDFGFSFHAEENDTTTIGYAGAFTPRYCAPEVSDHTSRNRKSDVFSLGCVFVEVLDTLEPEIGLREIDNLPYFKKLEKVRDVLVRAKVEKKSRTEMLRICYDMLEPNQGKRIDTGGVLDRITSLGKCKDDADVEVFCNACSLAAGIPVQATRDNLAVDFSVLSLDPPTTNNTSSAAEPNDSTTKPIKKRKKKKKIISTIDLNEEDQDSEDSNKAVTISWPSKPKTKTKTKTKKQASSSTSRLYCTLCNEHGHTSTSCPNECWTCGDLYHTSSTCPNKCWTCGEFGHFARDCDLEPSDDDDLECSDCEEVGHATDDCPNTCWTCGLLDHFARDCPDECFVCGRLGHATVHCSVGRCHGCGKVGHWRRDCGDACFECGELGHWAAQCPNKRSKKKKGRREDECFNCGETGHWAADCQMKKRAWQPIMVQVPQGPYRLKSRR